MNGKGAKGRKAGREGGRKGRKAIPSLSPLKGFVPAFSFRPSVLLFRFRFVLFLPACGRSFRKAFLFPSLVSTGTNRNKHKATGNETEPRGLGETNWKRNGREGRGGGPCPLRTFRATWGGAIGYAPLPIPHYVLSQFLGWEGECTFYVPSWCQLSAFLPSFQDVPYSSYYGAKS